MDAHEIDDEAQFIDIGLDSITGVTWVRNINEKYGTEIDATKVYSYPTLTRLGKLVLEAAEAKGTVEVVEVVKPVEAPKPAPVEKPAPVATSTVAVTVVEALTSWRSQTSAAQTVVVESTRAPVAVVGMAGQFPDASDIDAFWGNIAEGKNCISEVKPERWDLDCFFVEGTAKPGKTNSRWIGQMAEFDLFDPLFFNISPTEAECMDPQQRMFLQTCWQGIEDAGYNPQSLSGSKTGVFVVVRPATTTKCRRSMN